MFYSLICLLFFATKVQNNTNIENNRSLSTTTTSVLTKNNSKLLIILVDGFRWDYVSRDKSLKGFPRIIENGVQAEYVRPIFPANSYPNWYAISTGLYAESHGIVDNHMYDKETKEYFLSPSDANVSHSHWWTQTEPLWINAEKQGIRTSMYAWDGCQVLFNGMKASFCNGNKGYVFAKDLQNQNRVTRSNYKKILDDFSRDRYRMSFLYHEIVDVLGHSHGPNSMEVRKSVQEIDAILNDLFDDIIKQKLDKTLNVVIVSDHGMSDISNFKKIHLNGTVDFDNIELMIEWGSGSRIAPKPGKEDEVFKHLSKVKGIKVYRKEDIPESYHYKNNKMVLPILAIADFGNKIFPPKVEQDKIIPRIYNVTIDSPLHGGHGFDGNEPQMHAIMYGFGPAFKRNFTSGPIEMVDHYNLFCHLLGITPHPNNATFANVKPFLK